MYSVLADAVLAVHLAVVVFVVGGWLAVWVGAWLGWSWIRSPAFRWAHAVMLGLVIVQAWLGRLCPLTQLESWLRLQAGQPAYQQTFMQHWVHRFLFYDAPLWLFAVLYTGFGLLVLWTWWKVPPRARVEPRPPDAPGRRT
ncbi:DUF2784 domain-containing protein [Limisphaera sp. VF-2]|jgi:hypothetical protein|uniref:DUF2784 domain-containing protein n=1 Tax=Limisphaera sp. VF-2 TaxID=3400418 RepID=UPI003C17B1B4